MSLSSTVDADRFVATVQPLLQCKDVKGLRELLKANWTSDQILGMLTCDHCDARKVAALALALVGKKCCVDALARQLRDEDPMINQMAEHALWSIWFRSSTPEANHQLCRGSQAIERQEFDHAIQHFSQAVQIDPQFAEAYNQRAIALYLQEKFTDSILDCRKAVELMPCHFGAWAGLGHCHAHLNQPQPAIDAYERALEINPHLECIAEAVEELRTRIKPD